MLLDLNRGELQTTIKRLKAAISAYHTARARHGDLLPLSCSSYSLMPHRRKHLSQTWCGLWRSPTQDGLPNGQSQSAAVTRCGTIPRMPTLLHVHWRYKVRMANCCMRSTDALPASQPAVPTPATTSAPAPQQQVVPSAMPAAPLPALFPMAAASAVWGLVNPPPRHTTPAAAGPSAPPRAPQLMPPALFPVSQPQSAPAPPAPVPLPQPRPVTGEPPPRPPPTPQQPNPLAAEPSSHSVDSWTLNRPYRAWTPPVDASVRNP